MVECVSQILAHLQEVLQHSGRGLHYLGSYQNCLKLRNFNYNYVVVSGAPIGLCLPSVCTPKQLIFVFEVIAILKEEEVFVTVNNHPEDYSYSSGWAFSLTIALLVLLCLLTLIGSVYPETTPNKLLKSFDLRRNMNIFSRDCKSKMNALNGVRAIAMMWVVFGHYFSLSLNGSVNLSTITNKVQSPFFLLVIAGLYSVDIFFLLGGFLVAYIFLRQKSSKPKKYSFAILQRILRIWPAYILTILIYYSIYLKTGKGPAWAIDEPTVLQCSSMWRSILFVDNLVENGVNQCLGWGWYLQNDFQLFLASLVLLFIYQRNKKLFYVVLVGCLLGSQVFNVYFTTIYKSKVYARLEYLLGFELYMPNIYMKPWARCPPYFLGLLLGIWYQEYFAKKDPEEGFQLTFIQLVQRNRAVQTGLEAAGICLMGMLTLIPRDLQLGNTWSQLGHSFYLAIPKWLFPLSCFLTVIPSMLGCRTMINSLLTQPVLAFLAKISFCTYLLHYMVLEQYINSRSYNIYYSIIHTFNVYLGLLSISVAMGFAMTMIVEVPMGNLLKEGISWFKNKGSKKSIQGTFKEESESINQTVLSSNKG